MSIRPMDNSKDKISRTDIERLENLLENKDDSEHLEKIEEMFDVDKEEAEQILELSKSLKELD